MCFVRFLAELVLCLMVSIGLAHPVLGGITPSRHTRTLSRELDDIPYHRLSASPSTKPASKERGFYHISQDEFEHVRKLLQKRPVHSISSETEKLFNSPLHRAMQESNRDYRVNIRKSSTGSSREQSEAYAKALQASNGALEQDARRTQGVNNFNRAIFKEVYAGTASDSEHLLNEKLANAQERQKLLEPHVTRLSNGLNEDLHDYFADKGNEAEDEYVVKCHKELHRCNATIKALRSRINLINYRKKYNIKSPPRAHVGYESE